MVNAVYFSKSLWLRSVTSIFGATENIVTCYEERHSLSLFEKQKLRQVT